MAAGEEMTAYRQQSPGIHPASRQKPEGKLTATLWNSELYAARNKTSTKEREQGQGQVQVIVEGVRCQKGHAILKVDILQTGEAR